MPQRITTKDLESLISRLNGNKPITWDTIGAYRLDQAYGGVKLVQVTSEGGGIREISCDGYGTKRQLYTFLMGMLARQSD